MPADNEMTIDVTKDPLENYKAEDYINAGRDTVHIVKPNTPVAMAWQIFLTHIGRRTDKGVENFSKGDSGGYYLKFSHGYMEESKNRKRAKSSGRNRTGESSS